MALGLELDLRLLLLLLFDGFFVLILDLVLVAAAEGPAVATSMSPDSGAGEEAAEEAASPRPVGAGLSPIMAEVDAPDGPEPEDGLPLDREDAEVRTRFLGGDDW